MSTRSLSTTAEIDKARQSIKPVAAGRMPRRKNASPVLDGTVYDTPPPPLPPPELLLALAGATSHERVDMAMPYIAYATSLGADNIFIETAIAIPHGTLLRSIITNREHLAAYASALRAKADHLDQHGAAIARNAMEVLPAAGERLRTSRDITHSIFRRAESCRDEAEALFGKYVTTATSERYIGEREQRHAKAEAIRNGPPRFRDFAPLFPDVPVMAPQPAASALPSPSAPVTDTTPTPPPAPTPSALLDERSRLMENIQRLLPPGGPHDLELQAACCKVDAIDSQLRELGVAPPALAFGPGDYGLEDPADTAPKALNVSRSPSDTASPGRPETPKATQPAPTTKHPPAPSPVGPGTVRPTPTAHTTFAAPSGPSASALQDRKCRIEPSAPPVASREELEQQRAGLRRRIEMALRLGRKRDATELRAELAAVEDALIAGGAPISRTR